jgi:hypothetical protein
LDSVPGGGTPGDILAIDIAVYMPSVSTFSDKWKYRLLIVMISRQIEDSGEANEAFGTKR